MRYPYPFLLALACWLSAAPLFGWANPGHQLVAELAESRLEPGVRDRVRTLLGGVSLADVSVWADELIDTETCSHTEPWHYINIPDGKTLATADRSERGDLVSAYERFERQLRDPSSTRKERLWAVKYLIHLVGDLHQPLHVGRREDRGGNDLAVAWFGEATNLHLVWDFYLVDRAGIDRATLFEFARQHEEVLIQRAGDPLVVWLNESLEARRAPYDDQFPVAYDQAYVDRFFPVVERRLAEAGFRLAHLLNDWFRQPLELHPVSMRALPELNSPCAPERPRSLRDVTRP